MKYIEMIPENPNPYDSYADLLAKIGKYGPSIETFRKALAIDPNFGASHTGIATNLNLLGKHKEAREQLDKLYEIARDDEQRRRAIYARAVSFVDEGNPADGLKELQLDRHQLLELGDRFFIAEDEDVIAGLDLIVATRDDRLTVAEQ